MTFPEASLPTAEEHQANMLVIERHVRPMMALTPETGQALAAYLAIVDAAAGQYDDSILNHIKRQQIIAGGEVNAA